MIRLSLRNLWAHKRRLAGTFVAVVLGVAFLSGTLLLGDTLDANFARLFTQTTAGTDVVVRSSTTIGTDRREGRRPTIDAALVGTVARVDGVAEAVPAIEGYGQLLGHDGARIGGNGPPTRAGNWIDDESLNPYRIAEGRAPSSDDEVVINRGAAKSGGLHIGDTTTLLAPAPVTVRIVGISTFGTADGFGPSTFTGMTLHAAQQLLVNGSQVDEIRAKARPGTSSTELADRVRATLPPGLETITGAQVAAENLDEVNATFLGFVRAGLVGFAVIALLVAAFSIHNTFTIVVAQRERENALLRALGASKRQVVTTTLLESLLVGVAGATVGWWAGVGIAGGLKAMFDAFGFALPAGGLVFEASSTVIAIVTGVGATVVAGLAPALHGARVSPLAALRRAAVEPRRVTVRRVATGSALLATGVGAILAATAGVGGMMLGAIGAALTLVAAVILAPVVVGPVASALGAPAVAWRGITIALARENAARNPRRTAATASALMIGVTVVVLFTVVGASLKASATDAVHRSLRADLVVDNAGFGGRSGGGGFDPRLADDIGRVPGVAVSSGVGSGSARLGGDVHGVTVVHPRTVSAVLDLGVVGGSVATMDPDSVAVAKSAADDHHWTVGTRLPVVRPDGTTTTSTVAAVYTHDDLVGDYLVSADGWDPHAPQRTDAQVLIELSPGADTGAVKSALATVTKPYGAPRIQNRAEFAASQAAGVNTILGLVYVMLALAIVIALMGIANTLSLSIHERTRELGLLRAVGLDRPQARATIRWESLVIAVAGTAGGIVLGTFLGWAFVTTAATNAVGVFALPRVQLVAFLVIGALAGVVAGIRPARAAARVDVLGAIATE